MKDKTVCVLGLGYIGLPTAALLANSGFNVKGIDIDASIVEIINNGKVHIVEPDLESYVHKAVKSKKLVAYSTPQSADIYLICVPTPFYSNDEIPTPNIEFVIAALNSIAHLLKKNDLIILESTSPVGTTETIKDALIKLDIDTSDVHIAYCPERVLPGKILHELVHNDRIVGGLTLEATRLAKDFYQTFTKGNVLGTDSKTAEMCKLVENSYRDLNIAFANELSLICDKTGINVWELINLANHHPRVNILQPGVGVGGHCIAVDPWFIVAQNPKESRLIRTGREVNTHKTKWVINQIMNQANQIKSKSGKNPKIICYGLAFKPDIDDLRESPALEIALKLKSEGYNVFAIEPNIEQHSVLDLISETDALNTADIIVLLVHHKELRSFLKNQSHNHVRIMDFCGAYF